MNQVTENQRRLQETYQQLIAAKNNLSYVLEHLPRGEAARTVSVLRTELEKAIAYATLYIPVATSPLEANHDTPEEITSILGVEP